MSRDFRMTRSLSASQTRSRSINVREGDRTEDRSAGSSFERSDTDFAAVHCAGQRDHPRAEDRSRDFKPDRPDRSVPHRCS